MKFGPGAARATKMWGINAKGVVAGTSAFTQGRVLYLIEGTMPSEALITQWLKTNPHVVGATSYEPGINFADLWANSPSNKKLLAAFPYQQAVIAEKAGPNGLKIKLSAADVASWANGGATATGQIIAAGTPTWFVLAFCDTAVLRTDQNNFFSLTTQRALGQCIIGTVGDENSNADLKVLGGQILSAGTVSALVPIIGDFVINVQ